MGPGYPVRSKHAMYRLLEDGVLGNTIPHYSSLEEWQAVPEAANPVLRWAVRTKVAGGPFYPHLVSSVVPEVVNCVVHYGVDISVMLTSVGEVTFYGEAWDGLLGWSVSGREWPGHDHQPRAIMRAPCRWTGLAARLVLERHLNPSSLADLNVLRDRYPGHVYEFSTLDRNYGTVPGRNAVVWEVRDY